MTGFKGSILNALERYGEALDASICALRVDANLIEAHAQKSAALFGLGRIDEAMQASEAGLEIDAKSAALHQMRAAALLALERWEAALEEADRALVLNPKLALAHYVKACALYGAGEAGPAGLALKEGLKRGLRKSRPLESLAIWREALNDVRLKEIFENYRAAT